MRKKNATNSNLKLCHLNGDKAMEMWLLQSDKVCTYVLSNYGNFPPKLRMEPQNDLDFLPCTKVNHHQTTIWENIFYFFQFFQAC